MITFEHLEGMDLPTFSLLYAHSMINIEAEKVVAKILEENYMQNKKLLIYPIHLDHIYHYSLIESVKLKVYVSSIYIKDGSLVVDWSERLR
jgi:hypothetical protein